MKLMRWTRWLAVPVVAAGVYLLAGCDRSAALNKSTASVKHITQVDFENEVTRCPLPVVADFYATWCEPCVVLSPMIDHVAGDYTDKIKFVKINVDESPGLAQNFQAGELPLVILFKDGKVAERIQDLKTQAKFDTFEADFKKKLDVLVASQPGTSTLPAKEGVAQ
jgi:thioredoxin 1